MLLDPSTVFHRYIRSVPQTISILLPVILFACTSPATADQEPTVEDILITTSNKDLILFAAVKNCFTAEMIEGVHNAIPITFRFSINLYRTRNNWFDVELAEHGINHTLSYDPIKQQYQVAFSERNRPEVTKSLDEAKQMMAELNGIEVIPLNKLTREVAYTLHIKATLVENTFPLGIHSIIPFTSLWNFETEWRTVEFSY